MAATEITGQLLTEEQELIQQTGGTWSNLFNTSSMINKVPVLTVLMWLVSFWLLGVIFYPYIRFVFRQFSDKGYGISRFIGLIAVGYFVWLGSFIGLTYSKKTILLVIVAFSIPSIILYFIDKNQINREIRENKKEYLISEAVFLSCFFFFLLIRLGNPDLWHPYKGGEKPMDFSYFNAILKSTIFPPYDPWFSGGYLNYYYYGIYLSGLFVKLLGIVPSVAYNLIIPLWYAFLGICTYTFTRNIIGINQKNDPETSAPSAVKAGIISVLFMQVFGNLGTVVQIKNELVELGANIPSDQVHGFLNQFGYFFSGIVKLISGQKLLMYKGDWYWIPSRAIPDTSITEFPFFTFLYGDPHAHLFALPMTVLVLIWISAIIYRFHSKLSFSISWHFIWVMMGCLFIGTLFPTNTWDMPTYYAIPAFVLIYLGIVTLREKGQMKKSLFYFLMVPLIGVMIFILFRPYLLTNARKNLIEFWNDTHTPVSSYFMHWGLFLFLIISWYWFETVLWMKQVKYSQFRIVCNRYKETFIICGISGIIIIISLLLLRVAIAWIVLPLMVWSLVFIIRSDYSPEKRFICFLIGTALALTLFVELFHLADDNGRMNTVFKLYNQAWVLFALSGSFSVYQCTKHIRMSDSCDSYGMWKSVFTILVVSAFSYTIFAGTDKITDRMSNNVPLTLDGMKYMETSLYYQDGFVMDLSQDYDAIRWMQENIEGSPVIVEGNAVEYMWGNRYTIYTGLPSVIGWNYHQRQQRQTLNEEVWNRVYRVKKFYDTTDRKETLLFIRDYNVKYIVVGQMEEGLYAKAGIQKFTKWENSLWRKVYSKGDTSIYEVIGE